jgi:uncharacterized protein YifN (PemK superfamily)
MAILYAPAAGSVLLCNYGTGFIPPEMVKRRPCVVVSPRLTHRDGLCAVVPFSGTAPKKEVPYQVRLDINLPLPWGLQPRWVKADMVSTVCFRRLDMFRTDRDPVTGKRKYLQIKVKQEELEAIRIAILHGLGMGH